MLKEREIALINLLKSQKDFMPVKFFAKELDVSEKTIRNDLDNLEHRMIQHELEVKRVQGQGIRLIETKENGVEELLTFYSENRSFNYSIDITTRRIKMIYFLLNNSDEYTSIQKLAEMYYVSNSGILNDFKSIERWLEANDLELYRGQEGTKIIGKENQIRRALAQFILDFPSANPTKESIRWESRLDVITRNKLLELFKSEDIDFFESVISDIELYADVNIIEPYYLNLMTHLLISVDRSKFSDNLNEMGYEPISTKYLGVVDFISSKIENNFDIKYNSKEKNYIHQYILGTITSERFYESDKRISDIVNSLVNYVCLLTGYDLYGDESLRRGLSLHVQPMLNRVKFGIKINNPLKEQLLGEHESLFIVMKFVLNYLMTDSFTKQLTIDEISYIVTYIVAAVERKSRSLSCVVVCHSGFGTSQLLTERLKRSFTNLEVKDAFSSNQMYKIQNTKVDFIISTVYIENPPVPYLIVSALLDGNEKRKITEFMDSIMNGSRTINDKKEKYCLCVDKIQKNNTGSTIIYSSEFLEITVSDSSSEKKQNSVFIDKNTKYYIVLQGSNEELIKAVSFIYHLHEAFGRENFENELIKNIE